MKGEIKALTGLRFLAAFLVYVFHVNMRIKLTFIAWPIYNIISHGAFGVTVFFVLSGFLLAYSHQKDFASGKLQDASYFRQFLYRRFARIYPAYLAGLVLFAAAGAWFGELPKPAPLAADLTMVQAAIPSLAMQWYGGGAWSVSIEIFFYLFFPFLLPLLVRVQQARTLWGLLAIVVLAGASSGLVFNLFPSLMSYQLMYANPLFRCSEFIAGMITSLLVFRFGWRVKELPALALVILAAGYIALLGPRLIGFVVHNWLVVPAIVCLLAAVVEVGETKLLRFLKHPYLLFAGRISYCFYLAQLPFFFMQDLYLSENTTLPLWTIPATLVATTLTSLGLHFGIERPAHRWLMHKWQQIHSVSSVKA